MALAGADRRRRDVEPSELADAEAAYDHAWTIFVKAQRDLDYARIRLEALHRQIQLELREV